MQTGPSIESAEQLLGSLQSLPIGMHAPAFIGLAAGLALWLAGRRIIKPVFLVLGVALAGTLGFFLAPAFGHDAFFGYPSPFVGLGVGALVGLVGSAVLFRFTMAIASGASVAIAACLGAAIYLNANPTPDRAIDIPAEHAALSPAELALPNVPVRTEPDQPTESPIEAVLDQPPAPEDSDDGVIEVARTTAKVVRNFVGLLGAELGLIWSQLPVRDRSVISAAGFVGAILGGMLGLAMPKRASALFTALFGAAIWIPCLVYLLTAFDMPIGFLTALSARAWLIAWAVISLVGASSQWSGLATRRLRKTKDDDDDDDE